MNRYRFAAVAAAFCSVIGLACADEVASFGFQGNLNSSIGSSTLSALDPQGLNNYSSTTLYGQTRQVYNMVGSQGAGNNAGLQLDISSLIANNSDYSVEVMFDVSTDGGWRKIIDNSNRTQDQGLYVDPSNTMDYYPHNYGSTAINAGTFYNVVLTYSAASQLTDVYVNGVLDSTETASEPNIGDNTLPLSFFVDDAATGYNEYTKESVGLINIWNNSLSAQDVANIETNPFTAAPEPCSMVALAVGALALVAKRRRA